MHICLTRIIQWHALRHAHFFPVVYMTFLICMICIILCNVYEAIFIRDLESSVCDRKVQKSALHDARFC